jgi:hypothetical protein
MLSWRGTQLRKAQGQLKILPLFSRMSLEDEELISQHLQTEKRRDDVK